MSKPTPEERHEAAMKAKNTKARNKAQWEALTAAKAAAKQKDKPLVLEALRAVLADPEATTAQRLFAVAVLDNMMGYCFIPHSAKYPGADKDAATAYFIEKLDALQEKDDT